MKVLALPGQNFHSNILVHDQSGHSRPGFKKNPMLQKKLDAKQKKSFDAYKKKKVSRFRKKKNSTLQKNVADISKELDASKKTVTVAGQLKYPDTVNLNTGPTVKP